MSPLSDDALLAGFGACDPDAAAAFVRRFQGRVYGLALTILRDGADAEEAAQEAFVRAWRHADAYNPTRGGVAAWLMTIARNVSLDMLRLRRTEPVDPSALLFVELVGTEPGPEEREITSADARRMLEALAELPLDQQRAVTLVAFFGRTAREISDLEQVPYGTAKTRIRTAILKLHERLAVNNG